MPDDAPDYEPSASHSADKSVAGKYRCPVCNHTCSLKNIHPLVRPSCPKCFLVAIRKSVPQMLPLDPNETALEPNPGTTVFDLLGRGNEEHIPTRKMSSAKRITKKKDP